MQEGQKVFHSKYGEGEIVTISNPRQTADVKFNESTEEVPLEELGAIADVPQHMLDAHKRNAEKISESSREEFLNEGN
jgi:hypothetical protein